MENLNYFGRRVMVHGIWYILGFESHLRTKLIVAKHKSFLGCCTRLFQFFSG